MRDGAMRCPGAHIPDGLTERASIGAAYSIVDAALVEGKPDSLIELRADLVRIILAPYLGDSEAILEATRCGTSEATISRE